MMKSFHSICISFIVVLLGSIMLTGCQNGSDDPTASNGSFSGQPFTVEIAAPSDGMVFRQDQPITFSGTAEYGSMPVESRQFSWISDKDGLIGVGSNFTRSGLSENIHRITLSVKAPSGEEKTAAIELENHNSANGLKVLITSPPSGVRIKSYDLLTLEGTAIDPAGNVVTGHLEFEWRSSLDQLLGHGKKIEPGDFAPGLHQLTLTVKIDHPGGNGTLENSAAIEIFSEFDQSPGVSAEILAPISGFQLPFGEQITFTGGASEQDGTPITGTSLVWTSSMDGIVGIGETCIVNNMSPGTHKITMTVTASGGKKTATSIIVEVVK